MSVPTPQPEPAFVLAGAGRGGATQPRARLEELLQMAVVASPASGHPRDALTSRDVSRGPMLPPLPSGRRAA